MLVVLLAGALVGAAACSSSSGGAKRLRIVASFYPLAWAARAIAPDAEVVDLTPPGGEAHDLQLTARQRVAIQEASVLLIVGKGFQPDVERAASDARGVVSNALLGIDLLPSKEKELRADPHVWLDPVLMREVVGLILSAIVHADPANHQRYVRHLNELSVPLDQLHRGYQALATCELKTLVTTHEAFGYLAREYGLTQLGLTGLTPEAEPTARAIARARDLARRGEIAAIFFESSDEGTRIGRSVAGDVGVSARPLSTIESAPSKGDYLTQMTANLAELKMGLRCR
jgi:zinc transport system substrate-binding protein